MSKSRKKNRIRKSDYSRVLTTETLPYETPIIFSNDGLRNYVSSSGTLDAISQALVENLVFDIKSNARLTAPFHYKIKKSSTELRRLSLLHPASQWNIASFYKKYELFLLHFCSISSISIRAPSKVAGSYFTKSSWENVNQFKSNAVGLIETDQYARHSPSFFAYRGHDRLYKFFESPDYLALEKKFSVLQTLDVSKCFDSIYTHCLSWSTKDKEFTKKYVAVTSTFAQDFDLVMRQANHGETNGIAIGPEVSRIFAEIIFQRVDVNVISELSVVHGKKIGIDYQIRRYVDDVFIFTCDEALSKRIYETYADALLAFNLHVNAAKLTVSCRPFVTKKSRITTEATNVATAFFDKFLVDTGEGALVPKKIHKQFGLAKSFIDGVKATCSANDATYDDVSSYLVSVVTERVKKLVNVKALTGDENADSYRDAAMVLLEVQYFLYVVAPSVSASYKLCTSIVLICRFFQKFFPGHDETVKQWIYELSEPLFSNEPNQDWLLIDGMISLELVNVLLALRELGDRHLLPVKALESLFSKEKHFSYFDLVSCLFYIRNEAKYKSLRVRVGKVIDNKLSSFHDILKNTEKAHLFLDSLTCPYIHNRSKKKWVSKFFKSLSLPTIHPTALATFVGSVKSPWFVDWKDLDLLNSLEKKELKRAY